MLNGERIRRRRQELGLTLRELSRQAGVSPGYLSRIENEQASPSLDTLQAVATALDVPMFYFLDSAPAEPVVRAGNRRTIFFPDSHLGYELLTPELSGQMMAVLIHMEPGARRITPPLARPNEQLMFVLQGSMSIQVDGTVYELNEGDSIYYNGNLLREFATLGDKPLTIICCIIPPAL